MREFEATLINAGRAKHGEIAAVSADSGYLVSNAKFPSKLTVSGLGSFYMLGKLNSFDHVDLASGVVSGGEGYFQFIDENDDQLWASWRLGAMESVGVLTFNGGTGKWQKASGEIRLGLLVVPHENQAHESYVAGKGIGTISLPE